MRKARPFALVLTLSVIVTHGLAVAAPKAPGKKTASPAVDKPRETEPKSAAISDPVAVVEGTEIKKAELERVFASILAQDGRSPADIPEDQKNGAYRMILDDIIIDKLIARRAADIKVSDEEVDAAFQRYVTNLGSEEEIKRQIEKDGQSLESIKQQIRSTLRQRHWVDDQLTGSEEVTDQEAAEFYAKNPEQFKMPEQVRASHILVSVKPDATPTLVVEKEKVAQEILARVKKGEDFEKVAQEVSEDPSAKENHGDLSFFSKDQMVPEFSDAAFKMKKDEVSEPVRSQFGYHIIKLTDRKPPETVPLEQAKPQLLAFLKQQKKQAEVDKLIRGIREKADVKINLPVAASSATTPEHAKSAKSASEKSSR